MDIMQTLVNICAAVAIVSATVGLAFFIGLFIYAVWRMALDD